LVLLVDDDEDLLVALAAPLRRQGFEVAVATDAVTAVSTAVRQPPDVVIMDIGLPGGDGTMVMQRLHSLPQLAGVPVIMLSGRDPEKHRETALAAGAAAYLAKPIAPDRLAAAVVEALGGDPASS
jgi:DNA-binding response OmpR family regulator